MSLPRPLPQEPTGTLHQMSLYAVSLGMLDCLSLCPQGNT